MGIYRLETKYNVFIADLRLMLLQRENSWVQKVLEYGTVDQATDATRAAMAATRLWK